MNRPDAARGEDFEQKISRLRRRIDLLPPQERSHLQELAETIAGQHRRLHGREPHRHAAE
jgi:hypothetical protein